MFKKQYLLALASFLLIPAVTLLAGLVANAINPEIAAGHANYERNFRLLELAQHLSLLAGLSLNAGLWILTCFFLLKCKRRSLFWLPLAAFGPFGLIILTMLGDKAPASGDLYQPFVRRLKLPLRGALELGFFVLTWVLAFEAMVVKRELLILYEAMATGTPAAQIIDQQNASSGMWAFSEGLEVLYLVALLYLLLPMVFSVIGCLPRFLASSRQT